MYYTIYKGKAIPYTALAKETPFIYGHPVYEPGTTWFEFGKTKRGALNNLKKSLPGNNWIEWRKERMRLDLTTLLCWVFTIAIVLTSIYLFISY